MNEKIFKAYDIRGTYPDQVNEDSFKRIAQAFAMYIQPKTVAVGRDVRVSGPSLQKAVIEGLISMGVNVIDIGVVPTEMMYFAVGLLGLDGGIQVSASHNPAEYNGLKMVKKGVEAISTDTGLLQIKEMALSGQEFSAETKGEVRQKDLTDEYLDYIAKLVNLKDLPQLKIVANGNFGMSGVMAKKLIEKMELPIELVELNFEPDGTFPKGRPDPLIPENRAETSAQVKENGANMGVAWDADGDRCYIADESGTFIEGCHMTALLAVHLLEKNPKQKILYDPRNIYATRDSITATGGIPIETKTGHTFIKNRMRSEQALFAGEMSGHYYYRDFYNADNGLLTFLYFLELIAQKKQKVSEIAAPLREKYFVSGEINFKVKDAQTAIEAIKKEYPDGKIDTTDGISIDFNSWRFNLRSSNTEPLLRLNVESTDKNICEQKTAELRSLIEDHKV